MIISGSGSASCAMEALLRAWCGSLRLVSSNQTVVTSRRCDVARNPSMRKWTARQDLNAYLDYKVDRCLPSHKSWDTWHLTA